MLFDLGLGGGEGGRDCDVMFLSICADHFADGLQKPNLILNVDGFIGVAFVDLLKNCGCFTRSVLFCSTMFVCWLLA